MKWLCIFLCCLVPCLNGNATNFKNNPIHQACDLEKKLYLTPGGKYTNADIAANGSKTRSQKYESFMVAHNLQVQDGDKTCPITNLKAHQECTWVIGGKTYQFCCPSCIDEFVTLAKENPESIQEPEHYIK
jgi:YHS domain-containing protein